MKDNNKKISIFGSIRVVLILFILYMISFGPCIYLLYKYGDRCKVVSYACMMVFRPHRTLAYYSKTYYDYMMWWVKAANNSNVHFFHRNHKEYRQYYENT